MMSLTFNMVTILSKVVVTKIYILKWVDKILIKKSISHLREQFRFHFMILDPYWNR